jgi:hypothetical protein
MHTAEEQLARIGFARGRSEAVCWRARRLGGPGAAARPRPAGSEPAGSLALLLWRDLLARDARPAPYRISRVDGEG